MFKVKANLLFVLLTFLIFQSFCYGDIIEVPYDYTLIQDAVDNAINDDTVLVYNGTYTENLTVNSKQLIIVSQYAFSGDTADISATILDGSGSERVFNMNNFSGKIQGFTITNGYNDWGGGIRLYQSAINSSDTIVICDNIIRDNLACGIWSVTSKALIRNNIFRNNYDDYSGAGIYCYGQDSSSIIGNIFRDNIAEISGGAISCQDNCYNIIENNTMIHNTATFAGGFGIATSSSADFTNNIVVQNYGGGIEDATDGTFNFSCNNIWDNYDRDDYVGCSAAPDDIAADPKFCDTTINNFGLDGASPCVAAYNSCGVLIGAKDASCMDAFVDIGYIPDLAMGYETGNGVSVFIGDGVGFFGLEQNKYSVLCSDLTAADFDGDGNLDIVATDAFWEIKIYFGDGTGGMSSPDIISYDQPYAIASGDFGGDASIDFVVSDVTGNFINVYLNDGSGNFTPYGAPYPVGSYPVDIDTGHFNNDAYLDLVVVNETSNTISILLNDGSGGFATRADSTTGNTPKQVEVADFNGDTYLDLAITNNSDDDITVYLGDGSGAFTGPLQYGVGNQPCGIEIGHFNFDLIPDLVVTNFGDNTITTLVNDGSGGFTNRTDFLIQGGGTSPYDVAVGYLDDDDRHDLVVCHRSGNSMDIMLNNGSNQFLTAAEISCNNFPFVVLLDNFNNDYYIEPVSFTVTNTDDVGVGSLRWAMTEANNNMGRDTILFSTSGTIQPLSALPSLDDPYGTFILGSSAPEKAGSIIIDFSLTPGIIAILLSPSGKNNIIEGLTITNSASGIIIYSDSNIIINNHIHDLSGTGIVLNSGSYNMIGGYNVNEGNTIENTTSIGLDLTNQSDSNLIIGNQISNVLQFGGLYGSGIRINPGNFNIIDSNIITSSESNGITILSSSQFNTITRNLISDNGELGIDLGDDGHTANDGINDLDSGPNDLLNYPELDSIHINDDYSNGIWGYAAALGRVEFFVAEFGLDSTRPEDPSGFGEALAYLGYADCDLSGNFVDTIPQAYAWSKICMTATDTLGNTSEFGYNFNLLPAPFIVFAWADVSEKDRGQTDSVINLRVTDPNGDVIGFDAFDVLEQTLFPADYIETGQIDSINILTPVIGQYTIEALAEDGSPTDATYTIGIRIDGSLATFMVEGMSVPTTGGPPDSVSYVVEAGWHYLNGDPNRDDIINIFDVTFLITFLYKGGVAPDPEGAGDANCDGLVNIFDVTYLITYLYKGGPQPCNNPDAGD